MSVFVGDVEIGGWFMIDKILLIVAFVPMLICGEL
jgi:hypothetical protein